MPAAAFNGGMTSGFQAQLAAWWAADRVACLAERRIAPALDLYCQGLGRAPSARVLAAVKARRRAAAQALQAVLRATGHARRHLPLL